MDDTFRKLLTEWSSSTASSRVAVEQRIWATYGRTCTVMITDMSGFSRITQARGVLHFLSMIDRMQELALPPALEHGGELIKFVADNMFLIFPNPDLALKAGLAMCRACLADSEGREPLSRCELKVGIDHGRILVIDGTDFYGDAVNLASKLGEDTAEANEVLITANAGMSVQLEPGYQFVERTTHISGLDLRYFALMYE